MLTNILEYGASQFTPGAVKSLSQEGKIDQVYLKKVIAASKGEGTKETPKEMKINFAMKKKPSKKPGDSKKITVEQVTDKLVDLKVDGYSDDEGEQAEKEVKVTKDLMTNLDFLKQKSSQYA